MVTYNTFVLHPDVNDGERRAVRHSCNEEEERGSCSD
jgi:hypothetical protein